MTSPWLDKSLITTRSPFSQALDKIVEKLEKDTDPHGAAILNQWAAPGGITVRTFADGDPRDIEFSPSEMPGLSILPGPMGYDTHGEGHQEFSFSYRFRGVVYGADMRQSYDFLWMVMIAMGHPWMQGVDPLVDVDHFGRYTFEDFESPDVFGDDETGFTTEWEFSLNFVFSGTLPFLRGLRRT